MYVCVFERFFDVYKRELSFLFVWFVCVVCCVCGLVFVVCVLCDCFLSVFVFVLV